MSGPKAEKYFRYVPYHREKAYESVGWQYSGPLGPPHCSYASLYEWPHDGEPVEPSIEIDKKIGDDKIKNKPLG